jgi:hypothetical protein
LIVFIFQFRSQNIAIKDAAYQKALDDYTNSIALLVEKPELAPVIDQIAQVSRAAGPAIAKLTAENRRFLDSCY